MLKRLRQPENIVAALRLLILFFIFSFLPTISLSAQVTLAWDPNDPVPDGYRLYHRVEYGDYDYGNPIYSGPETTTTIYDLEDGRTHFFVVRAYEGDQESADSNEVSYTPIPFEFGDVSINHQWTRVSFHKQFTDPVVVAGPISLNDKSPAVIRIRNVDKTGFEIRVQEWNYLDGEHLSETASYLVMEKGSYTLDNGVQIEADTIACSAMSSFEDILFRMEFDIPPVLITSITSFNGGDTVTERVKKITTNGFYCLMQEQESKPQTHNTEMLSYIAWEPSSGYLGDTAYLVDRATENITHNFYSILFNMPFMTPPAFFSEMQHSMGMNPANIRYTNKDESAVDVRISEEQSFDEEIYHIGEPIGYFVLHQ